MKISCAGPLGAVLALAVSLAGAKALASHNIRCELEAEVVEVARLARLNGVVQIFRVRSSSSPKNHVETVTLRVTKVGKSHGCSRFPVGSKRILAVAKRQFGHFEKGQRWVLSYHNQGDVMASRISWKVKRRGRGPARLDAVEPRSAQGRYAAE